MISGFPSDTLTTLMLSGSRNVTHFSRLRTQTWSEASAACAGAAQASSQAAARPIFKLFFMDSPWGSGRILAGNQRRPQRECVARHAGDRAIGRARALLEPRAAAGAYREHRRCPRAVIGAGDERAGEPSFPFDSDAGGRQHLVGRAITIREQVE